MSEKKSKYIRLNRYLAQCGIGSRRECDALIAQGKIFINGTKVTLLGTKIIPNSVMIEYQGKGIKRQLKLEYLVYHKAKGTIVSKNDPQGRETIFTALKKGGFNAEHLNYVGRLDRNSEGLLLLTNDGEMIHALTHPRYHIKKVYRVRINTRLEPNQLKDLIRQGIVSEGQNLRVSAICELTGKHKPEGIWYEIVLHEGKNRQIRRIFEYLGYRIIRLKRVQFSAVKLANLKRGAFRSLTDQEIKALKSKGYPINN